VPSARRPSDASFRLIPTPEGAATDFGRDRPRVGSFKSSVSKRPGSRPGSRVWRWWSSWLRLSVLESLTPLRFLERSAAVFPDKLAIVCGDRRFTCREFADEATVIAQALRASGIQPGDRVAYLSPNIAEMLIAHAVPLAGSVLVAMNRRLSQAEVGYIGRHSGAKLLIVDEELRSSVPDARSLSDITELIVIADSNSTSDGVRDGVVPRRSYEELIAEGLDPDPAHQVPGFPPPTQIASEIRAALTAAATA